METPRTPDADGPDEVDRAEETEPTPFGEQDEERQEGEWEEDAAEGGE